MIPNKAIITLTPRVSILSRLMGKGSKALLWKLSKEQHATVYRIYYSGFVYKAATCILHFKTKTLLLAFSAKLFSWVELMTYMLEETSANLNISIIVLLQPKKENDTFVQWNNMGSQSVQFLPLPRQLAALIECCGSKVIIFFPKLLRELSKSMLVLKSACWWLEWYLRCESFAVKIIRKSPRHLLFIITQFLCAIQLHDTQVIVFKSCLSIWSATEMKEKCRGLLTERGLFVALLFWDNGQRSQLLQRRTPPTPF